MASRQLQAVRPDAPRPRVADWAERLAALMEARLTTPFAWGRHDCVTLAADAVVALTGHDPIERWRGRYATEAEAEAILDELGGLFRAVAEAWDDAGLPQVDPKLAQRGDTALVMYDNQLVMGVVIFGAVAVPAANGLAFVPLPAIQRAWVT